MLRRGRMRRAMAVMWAVSVSVLIACAGRPVSVPAKPPPGVGSVQVTRGGYSGGHVVGITVGVPGSVASGAVSRDGNRGGTSSGCDQACQQHSQMCAGQNPLVFDPSQPHGSAQWLAFLQAIGCAAAPAGAGPPPPPPTAAQLAQWAYGQLRLPAPVPARYPSGTLGDGRPYTIVKTHMWFSTDAGAWHPVSKTVCAGALCATATATPSSLSFDPGNGDASVSCPGPGTRFAQSGGSWIPGRQPQGCDYQYLDSTYGRPNGELMATYTITWTVAWTGTNGTAGALDPMTTAAGSTFAVAELQSVVTQ